MFYKLFISALALSAITQAGNIYNYIPTIQVNIINGGVNTITQNNRPSFSQENYAPNNADNRPRLLYSDPRTYHLGDENFRSRKWVSLHGQCYFIPFTHDGGNGNYYLSLQRYGTESAALFLNEEPVGYLPSQVRGRRKRPNYWSHTELIQIPHVHLVTGNNQLAVCASPVPRPEFPGDLDDFQIRNIKLLFTGRSPQTSIFSKQGLIRSIKKMYREVESNIESQFYRVSKREESFDFGGISAKLYRDGKGHIRKLHLELGSEDSVHTASYYYRPDGTLFFSFLSSASVHGCGTELRSYFDYAQRLVTQKRSENPKCGYTLAYKPKVTNPLRLYNRLEP